MDLICECITSPAGIFQTCVCVCFVLYIFPPLALNSFLCSVWGECGLTSLNQKIYSFFQIPHCSFFKWLKNSVPKNIPVCTWTYSTVGMHMTHHPTVWLWGSLFPPLLWLFNSPTGIHPQSKVSKLDVVHPFPRDVFKNTNCLHVSQKLSPQVNIFAAKSPVCSPSS